MGVKIMNSGVLHEAIHGSGLDNCWIGLAGLISIPLMTVTQALLELSNEDRLHFCGIASRRQSVPFIYSIMTLAFLAQLNFPCTHFNSISLLMGSRIPTLRAKLTTLLPLHSWRDLITSYSMESGQPKHYTITIFIVAFPIVWGLHGVWDGVSHLKDHQSFVPPTSCMAMK